MDVSDQHHAATSSPGRQTGWFDSRTSLTILENLFTLLG